MKQKTQTAAAVVATMTTATIYKLMVIITMN